MLVSYTTFLILFKILYNLKMWQKKYKKRSFYWGLKPEKGLKEVLKYTPKGIALDIGAGEGRNSIFLAKNGFKVEAIDKNKEVVKKLKKAAKKFHLKILAKVADVRKFNFPSKKYSLVVAITVLDFLKKSEGEKIVQKIKKSLITQGIFYLILFSTKDPWFFKIKKLNLKLKIKSIEKILFIYQKVNFIDIFFL